MNTRKQVLIMSALLAMMLIITGVYAAWYPSRAIDAETHFDEQTNERGALLFARNCRLCHGDVAEGGALGARLPAAPALHRPDLQGFTDSKATLRSAVAPLAGQISISGGTAFKAGQVLLIEEERMKISRVDASNLIVTRGEGETKPAAHPAEAVIYLFDADSLKDKVKLITNTITCGRVGTAMPPWAQTQGGPLSDEQVRQLMTLITQGRWDLVQKEVNIEDLLATKVNIKNEPVDWAKLTEPMSEDTISMRVTNVTVFNEKEAIRIGDERLRVTGVPQTTQENGRTILIRDAKDKSGIIQVERGVLGTTPLEHSTEETIRRFPETAEPSVTQQSCGQFAQAPAVSREPRLIPDDQFTGQTVPIIAQGVQFNTRTITVNAGGRVRVRLDNRDAGVDHNIAFYRSSTETTQLLATDSRGATFKGPGQDDTVFDIPPAGSYFFRCDVHATTMTGTFTVR